MSSFCHSDLIDKLIYGILNDLAKQDKCCLLDANLRDTHGIFRVLWTQNRRVLARYRSQVAHWLLVLLFLLSAASVTVVQIQVLLVLLALLALLVACIASISRVDCRHYWWNTWNIGIKRQLRILFMNIQFEIPVVNTLLPPIADFRCHRQLKEDEIPLDFLPCEFVQGLRAKRLEWQVRCSSAPLQYKRLLLL